MRIEEMVRGWRQAGIMLLALVGINVNAAEVLHEERSVYRNIFVTEEGGRRCLLFNAVRGERNQTCMNTANPR